MGFTGCRITQRFEVLSVGPIAERVFFLLVPAHRDRSEALRTDLVREQPNPAEQALAILPGCGGVSG